MRRVYVGMSGGVDSSVAAALCQQQGYDVVGVYMKNWTRDVGGIECAWRDDLADAQSVAAQLDIPLEIFDFEAEYKQRVVDYMLEEYQLGRTPNPDIMCNQEIKFKLFLDVASERGADLIATGHYAAIRPVEGASSRYGLFCGRDRKKDQSYFLYRVTAEALERSLFPLEGYTKTEVRDMAGSLGLSTASKPDSQGICFVGEVNIKEFLQEFLESEPGPIRHYRSGEVLGEHEGAALYTIGQRQGLGVGGGLPLYVAEKDLTANTVWVTEEPETLLQTDFYITAAHWIDQPPRSDIDYLVRNRHQGELVPAQVEADDNGVHIRLQRPERAVTPGQSTVVYQDTPEGIQVVGGGIVTS